MANVQHCVADDVVKSAAAAALLNLSLSVLQAVGSDLLVAETLLKVASIAQHYCAN